MFTYGRVPSWDVSVDHTSTKILRKTGIIGLCLHEPERRLDPLGSPTSEILSMQ